MINEIRSYFKSVIAEVDPDLKQHEQYFISSNISDTKKEDTYFLKIGNLTTLLQDTNFTGEFAVELQVWKNGNNDVINRLDTAYCNAIEIQAKLMDNSRIDQLDFIKGVNGISIEVLPVEDNDNLAQFTLQFTVTVGYKSF